MRFLERDSALELMDALLIEGFTVKMWAYRVHDGKPSDLMDKRTWIGGVADEVVVDGSVLNLRDAIRVQSIAETLGYEAWISNDEDGFPAIKIQMDFKKKASR